MTEALILTSTNPQYDDRLFIELQVQYMKIPSSNLGRTCCVQKSFLTFRTIFVLNMFSQYNAKRRASDKDLPVKCNSKNIFYSFCRGTKESHANSKASQKLASRLLASAVYLIGHLIHRIFIISIIDYRNGLNKKTADHFELFA